MPDKSRFTRRRFVQLSAAGTALLADHGAATLFERDAVVNSTSGDHALGSRFLITPLELVLQFSYPEGERRLSFKNRSREDLETWRNQCRAKLGELLNFRTPEPCPVKELRRAEHAGIAVQALVMQVSGDLSIPAYLLVPGRNTKPGIAVMAIHGHGEVEPCIGLRDDYHHQFALKLAQQGYLVLCPELRGFGVLSDLDKGRQGYCLDYWPHDKERQFSLATDSFLKRKPMIGTTVEDLLRWEHWLGRSLQVEKIHAVGISYGGDLALLYPAFSSRVDQIFASGTLGSFRVIFSECYNAPAHCVPGILEWMDRSDIAGLNAPRPVTLQYGELDVPGPNNASAAYNATVPPSIEELRAIYARMNAADKVRLVVSKGLRHEMDVNALLAFLGAG